MSPFEGGNMETQGNVLSYRVDLYFHDYKLATEIDKSVHSDHFNSPKTTLNLISLTVLVTPHPFTQFQPKIWVIKLQIGTKTSYFTTTFMNFSLNLVLKNLQVCFRTILRKIKEIPA